jgi:hypothetical protein
MSAPANPFQMDAPNGRFFNHPRTVAPKILKTAQGKIRNRKIIRNCSFAGADNLFDISVIILFFKKYGILSV